MSRHIPDSKPCRNTPDLAAPVGMVSDSRPATEGDMMTIYANGMGPVDPPIEDGHNSCQPDGGLKPGGNAPRQPDYTLGKLPGGVVAPDHQVKLDPRPFVEAEPPMSPHQPPSADPAAFGVARVRSCQGP